PTRGNSGTRRVCGSRAEKSRLSVVFGHTPLEARDALGVRWSLVQIQSPRPLPSRQTAEMAGAGSANSARDVAHFTQDFNPDRPGEESWRRRMRYPCGAKTAPRERSSERRLRTRRAAGL